ncbi:hypothetical protein [Polaribacter sargassicola]|uniref:hypothetical protein n=1 Tax=Polaribacter sargassicola TaxID=2836891 RepID=UPI001F1EA158|nr:hypothetical protein [Polaribacter sp. DS7-9]MCG1036289.1 hypothetical protein [Polaribacter sp. DS7-9]
MKKGLLLLLGMFIMVSTLEANNNNNLPNTYSFNYSLDDAVSFEEKGVEFFVFINGEFDFNPDFYDRNGRLIRRNINIDRDFRGRIRKVGNSYINYDSFGNVTRIGNVSMRYYRGQLTRVGNLRISYDRWGYPIFNGNVKNNYFSFNGIRINLNIGDIFDYNNAYFYHRDFSRNYSKIREDNRYFYYRAKPNAKIGKRSQILRRRKPVVTNIKRNSSSVVKRSNNSYRKPSNNNVRKNNTNQRNNNNKITTYRRSTTNNNSKTSTRNNNTYKKRTTTKKSKDNKSTSKDKKRG